MTIIHPHHPLRGQQVQIIRIRRGLDPDLIVRLPDGAHAAIAMSCTDYACLPPFEDPSGSPHLLALEGLRHAAHFVAQLRQGAQAQGHAEGEHLLSPPPPRQEASV